MQITIDKKTLRTCFIVSLIVLSLLPIWLVKFPPLQDYPNHLLRAKVIYDYNNPLFDYNKHFIIQYSFLPNLISDIIIPFLAHFVPIVLAGKIFLSIYVILLPLSIFYFLNAIDKEKAILGFFGFPLIYNGFFNMGFINFCFSIPVFFFALGYWWRNRKNFNFIKIMTFSLLVLIVYFSHIFTYGILLVSIFFLFLIEIFHSGQNRGDIKKCILLLIVALLPSFICFFSYFLEISKGNNNFLRDVSFYPLIEKLKLFKCLFFSSSNIKRDFAFFSFSFFLLLLFLKSFYKSKKDIFFSLFIFLFIIFLLLPVGVRNFYHIDSRLIPFLVFIFLACIYPVYKKLCWISIGGIIVLSFLWTGVVLRDYLKIDKDLFNHYFAVIKAIPPQKTLFPIQAKGSEVMNPYLEFCAYYHIFKGGVSPYLPCYLHITPMKYKKILPAPEPFFVLRSKLHKVNLKNFLKYYDYILICGKNEELFLAISRLATLVSHQGDIEVFKVKKG